MGNYVKSDYSCPVTNIHPLYIFTRCLRLVFSPVLQLRRWFYSRARIMRWPSAHAPSVLWKIIQIPQDTHVNFSCLHMHKGSLLLHSRTASTVIPLKHNATFTLAIQPKLGLPLTIATLTSYIDTLLVIRYTSILSTCPHGTTLSYSLYTR